MLYQTAQRRNNRVIVGKGPRYVWVSGGARPGSAELHTFCSSHAPVSFATARGRGQRGIADVGERQNYWCFRKRLLCNLVRLELPWGYKNLNHPLKSILWAQPEKSAGISAKSSALGRAGLRWSQNLLQRKRSHLLKT